jgi:lysyl endopeptidase
MKSFYYAPIFIVLCFFFTAICSSQIYVKSRPPSFQEKVKPLSGIPMVIMPSFNISAMIKEDSMSYNQTPAVPFRFGKCFNVNYSLKNSGLWETLSNSDRIWRLGIGSPGAYSMCIVFSEYDLPEGAKVFIYSRDTANIIGAFTSQNNNPAKILATTLVWGDKIVVEYYEPNNVKEKGKLTIGTITHDYKGVLKKPNANGDPYLVSSASCEKNIICYPDWQNEKRAVALTLFSGGSLCSGALINNIKQDGKLYFLTANHCISTQADATTLVTAFNYESPTCDGGNGNLYQSTISGAILRATNPYSDFTLLELSSFPPVDFNPYYLGWDASGDNPPVPATCIHHPNGEVKKISITDNSSLTVTLNTKDTWRVPTWAVGIIEPGSSGSSLMDHNRRVIGQDYAGSETCEYPHNEYFGRFCTSWAYGGSSATELKDWLDPNNTGIKVLDGMDCSFYISNQTINTNTTVTKCRILVSNVTIQNPANVVLNYICGITINGPFQAQQGTTLQINK